MRSVALRFAASRLTLSNIRAYTAYIVHTVYYSTTPNGNYIITGGLSSRTTCMHTQANRFNGAAMIKISGAPAPRAQAVRQKGFFVMVVYSAQLFAYNAHQHAHITRTPNVIIMHACVTRLWQKLNDRISASQTQVLFTYMRLCAKDYIYTFVERNVLYIRRT